MVSPVQMSLGVSLKDDATFANFYSQGGKNAQALDALKSLALSQKAESVVLWGSRGAGLTHLLQASCHQAHLQGLSLQYLPMREVLGYSAEELCEGMENAQLVCVDGIDLVCENRAWEQAMFHLFNNTRDAGHSLLFSSHINPTTLPIQLPDLKSRILGSVIYPIESLDDEEKQAAIVMRAHARGFNMPPEVAKYILSHASRNTSKLFELLNRLDEASLQQQRKLTIPFVKDILNL
ncbi:MAG: DnaA family protein [Lentisphaeria bacterium]|jgi:DnaA family protein